MALAIAAGVVYGTLVAVVPTVLGGVAVVAVLSWRHRPPASLDAVRRDLTLLFVTVVALLDMVALGGWFLLCGLETLHVALLVALGTDGVVALMLRPARSSIATAWAEPVVKASSSRLTSMACR